MRRHPNREQQEHELTMHVFAVAAAMVGVCLTAIGILNLIAAQTQVQTIGDDLLAVLAFDFMLCALLAFWSFKTPVFVTRKRLRIVVDTLFLVGLVGMAGVCAIIAYALV